MTTITALDGPAADDADIAAVHAVFAAAMLADRPGDPVPTLSATADRLRSLRGGRRTFRWVARDGGTPVGHLVLGLPDDSNTHLGLLDLVVHPEHRRRGTGTALLREAVRATGGDGRRTVLVEAYAGTAGEHFARALGLRAVQNERISLLRLADVDWTDVTALAAAAHPGYRLERWADGCPDELVERFARAKATMNEAPSGDIDWTGRTFDVQEIRDEEDFLRSLGRTVQVVVALDEAGGDIAALTEVVIDPEPYRSHQEDTAVVAGHRGRGLGLWVKAAMLTWLRDQRPDVAELITGNADANAHMLRINDRLGYRPHALLQEWQADVPTLAARL
jgi:GNAT superfamily N-acetyltransferase